ncbi:MAG TPA: NADH-quinone oxidoreductase subunit M [Acidimicrobiales bacterium]|nr:NADH-quinone oxidoreductase subunit M [Acidimicrobiales bacterium]
MDFIQDWGLTAMVFAPIAGVALMMLFPKDAEDTHKWLALIASLVSAGLGIAVFADFDYDNTGTLQFVRNNDWIEVINARFAIGIDGLSVPLIALTLLIVPLVIVYSWNHFPEPHNPKAFLALILVLHTGMLGSFVAQDLILFFVFFEIVLLPMYFLIGVWGGPERMYAAIKFFLYTLFGSAFMILSFLALFFLTGAETFLMQPIDGMAGLNELVAAGDIARATQILVFGGMFLGFAIKVPMFPFHTWLPDAHTQAPTQGSVILAAVLLKLGTYGFIRVALPILPEAAEAWAPWIGLLAVIGIIYGALGCLAQTDMKRLIAFSSVAHMGYTMLGISTLTDFGMNAAVFGMVAHGLITGMLFFLAGSVKERYHTLEIKRLGGLLVSAPRMGWILGFCTMASLGLPGLAGFWGEFPAILAAYQPMGGLSEELFRVYMVVAAIGTVFAAGYLLWLYQRTAFGVPKDEFVDDPHIHDVETPEWLSWSPLLVLILVLGVYPNLLFKVTDGTIVNVAESIAAATGN